MRAPNEIRTVWSTEETILRIAGDLLGLLGCIGFMALLLLFLAGGL